jgi:membrane protease YdiL (CAAX protease family)
VVRGDRPSQLFFGNRRVLPEARTGVFLIPAAFLVAAGVLLSLRALVPWMHNVENNPFQDLLRRPRDAALFAMVAVVAGGVREELQRAFILNRFERSLGGGVVGVIVGSAMFGAGHAIQGTDAAVATAVLGAFWGIVYLRRRSVVAPIISHSGFDLLQLLQLIAIGR